MIKEAGCPRLKDYDNENKNAKKSNAPPIDRYLNRPRVFHIYHGILWREKPEYRDMLKLKTKR